MSDYEHKPESYYYSVRPEMIPYIPENAKTLLDIGCGEGHFAAQIKEKYGAEVWGVELMPEVAKKAEQQLDKVFVGDVFEYLDQIPDGKFDCVTFFDVLEHVLDPYTLLQKISPKLSPNGVVVASIPNVRFLKNIYNLVIKKDWEYTDEGILDKTHVRFFTQKSMRRLFEENGFEILQMQGNKPTQSLSSKIFNLITLGRASDMLYLQFAIVAKPKQ